MNRHSICIPFIVSAALTAPAAAQVTVDMRALEQAPNASSGRIVRPSHSARNRPAPAKPVKPQPPGQAGPLAGPEAARGQSAPSPAHAQASTKVTEPNASATNVQPQPVANGSAMPSLPSGVPPLAHLSPGEPAEQSAPQPKSASPAPLPESDGSFTPVPGGLRVLFAPNGAALSPLTEQALKNFAENASRDENVSFDVRAYAAGTPDDASTARRLSLSRSLAVRSVLLAEGIKSAQIYVRALGSNVAGGPADRVDVTVSGANPTAQK